MICYCIKESKSLTGGLKSAKSKNSKNATVKVEELAKEVNSYLNNSSDKFIEFKYNQYQKKVKNENTQHVFKRLLDDANLKVR